MAWLAVGIGGALGSLARHAVNVFFGHVLESSVPYATATVNLVGSFVIGLMAGLIAHATIAMSANVRTFVFVGVLGGFTTFSSFALDTLTLSQGGQLSIAFWNVTVQVVLGLAAVYAGYSVGLGHVA